MTLLWQARTDPITWTSRDGAGVIEGGGEIVYFVESDLVLFWPVQGYVQTDLTLFWNSEPPFTSVLQDLTLAWNIITEPTAVETVEKDLVLFWQRGGYVETTLTLSWRRYGLVGNIRVLPSAGRISVDPPTVPTIRALGNTKRIFAQRAA